MEKSPSAIIRQINDLQKEIVKTYNDELLQARIRIAELEQENKKLKLRLGIEND